MKIGLASDHRGYKLKEILKKDLEKNYEVIDYGSTSLERVDFPDYAQKLGNAINKKQVQYGIAICGTGIGISIALNKIKNIMCAKVSTKKEAKLAKEHNHAQVIALSGNLRPYKAKQIVREYLKSEENKEEAYIRRIDKINNLR